MTVWKWLKRYWYIPLLLIAGILIWFFFRRSGTPLDSTLLELRAIRAEADVEKLEARVGTDKAIAVVEANYEAEMEKLDEAQKEEAKELRRDPKKLARFLVRAGGRS